MARSIEIEIAGDKKAIWNCLTFQITSAEKLKPRSMLRLLQKITSTRIKIDCKCDTWTVDRLIIPFAGSYYTLWNDFRRCKTRIQLKWSWNKAAMKKILRSQIVLRDVIIYHHSNDRRLKRFILFHFIFISIVRAPILGEMTKHRYSYIRSIGLLSSSSPNYYGPANFHLW